MWNDKILPEVADLYEGSGLGSVPGVLVHQEEDDLLQSYGNLTEDGVDMFRQLKWCNYDLLSLPTITRLPAWPALPVWRSLKSCDWPGWHLGHRWSRRWRPCRGCRGRCRWRSSPCAGPRVLWGSVGQLVKYKNIQFLIITNIVQVGLGGLGCFGGPDWTDNLGISVTHLLWKYFTNFMLERPSVSS